MLVNPPVAKTGMPACRNATSACRHGELPPRTGLRAAERVNLTADICFERPDYLQLVAVILNIHEHCRTVRRTDKGE